MKQFYESLINPSVSRNNLILVNIGLVICVSLMTLALFINGGQKTDIYVLDNTKNALKRDIIPYKPISRDGVELFVAQALPLYLNMSHNKEAQAQQFKLAERMCTGHLIHGDGESYPGARKQYADNLKYILSRKFTQTWHTLSIDVDASKWPIAALVTGFAESQFINPINGARDLRNQQTTFYVEVAKATDADYPYGLVISAVGNTDAETKQSEQERIDRILKRDQVKKEQ